MRRRGLTLLEVLAALVILATLLTGLLVVKSRSERQYAMAERRLRAVAAADELILKWWSQGSVPPNSAGNLLGYPDLRWQTRIQMRQSDGIIHSSVIRVEMIDVSDKRTLASVDLWMPGEPPNAVSKAEN